MGAAHLKREPPVKNGRVGTINKKFESIWYMRELELPKNWPGDEHFKLLKSKFLVCHFSSTVIFK